MNVFFNSRIRRGAMALAGLALLFSTPALADAPPFPGADPELIKAAQAEGQLTVYSSQNEELTYATVQAFNKVVPGIDVRILRLTSGGLYSRLAEEFKAGIYQVDVIGNADPRVFIDNPTWWAPIDKQTIPTLATFPDSAINPTFVYTSQGMSVIAYNTDMMSEADSPHSWKDLLKPEFKGQGMFVDPRSANSYVNWMAFMEQFYGPDYLKQLGTQDYPLANTAAPGVQEVAAGSAKFIFPVNLANVLPMIEAGAPIAFNRPWEADDVPGTGPVTAFAISAHAQHPSAARLYLTWLLTPDAQKINCGGAYTSLGLTKDDHGQCQPPIEKFLPTTDIIPDDKQAELLKDFGLQ